jgi:acetyl-CoA carboxylase biotin carboxyl carrier protein
MAISDDDVREILRLIDESPLAELHVETEGFVLHVTRDAGESPRPQPPAQPPNRPPGEGLLTIEAPMIGTFYRAPGPGEPPFVDVGSTVEPTTVVCIIEVMKMMNSVPAGVAGTVVEVCRENAQPVEYGQPLFRVRPA